MDPAVFLLIAGGLIGMFAYLVGASFLRKGDARMGHLLMWGAIVGLIVVGLVVTHEWAPFLLFAAFVLVGQAATEMWRLRRSRARAARR